MLELGGLAWQAVLMWILSPSVPDSRASISNLQTRLQELAHQPTGTLTGCKVLNSQQTTAMPALPCACKHG